MLKKSACMLILLTFVRTLVSMQSYDAYNNEMADLKPSFIENNFKRVIKDNDYQDLKELLDSGIRPTRRALTKSLYSSGTIDPMIIQSLILYADNEEILEPIWTNMHTITVLDQNLQDFLKWHEKFASTENLSDQDAFRFAAIALINPASINEFQKLLPFFRKSDYVHVFTPDVIFQALLTRNIKAFELLIPKIAGNQELMDRIKTELKKVKNIDFAQKIQKMINKEEQKMKGFKTSQFTSVVITK